MGEPSGTAAAWDDSDCPGELSEWLDDVDVRARPGRDRKFRLLLVALCRELGDNLRLPTSRATIEAAERYADDPGSVSLADMQKRSHRSASAAAERARLREPGIQRLTTTENVVWAVHRACCTGNLIGSDDPPNWYDILNDFEYCWSMLGIGSHEDAARSQARLMREIFPNPFRPVVLAPEWRTSTVLALAREIYETRAFDGLPLLADALEDAGCDNEHLLGHCRGTSSCLPVEPAEGSSAQGSPHVRGCWALDLILGKE